MCDASPPALNLSCAPPASNARDLVIQDGLGRQSSEADIGPFSPASMLFARPTDEDIFGTSNERTNAFSQHYDMRSSAGSTTRSTKRSSQALGARRRGDKNTLWSVQNSFIRPNSPFSGDFLADDYNRLHINRSLLKIYHDSLEGALSCWLTERNCPYSFSSFNGSDTWGSQWGSRMVMRVCALDNEYSKAGLLSKSDYGEGSRVLNIVVLAFAAQWTQAGQRYDAQPTRHTSTPGSHTINEESGCKASTTMDYLEENSFGRNAQKTLWHQANQALRTASDNTSFRAIFAGIIFSLTQRPMNSTEVLEELNSTQDDGLTSLFSVLDIDGPTVSLDAALRKLHDHQRKIQGAKYPGVYGAKAPRRLSPEHMETFGLLYWLAVMFDTLSAAMNRRSFTIGDADTSVSRLERQLASADAGMPQSIVSASDDADVWGDYFLRDHSYAGDVRRSRARWPCEYVDAAACLADAAPVKVLLYRRLGHLQGLFYQKASSQQIEDAFEAAMEVYNHWSNTYALFIDDCIQHHEELPARIQSWYTLLCGHWNLAVLMLLDLIDTLDNAEMTMPSHRTLRQQIQFTGPLRETAVAAISELGRCCTSSDGEEPLAFSQSPDFHRAVNKAALLTEPWTVVLVRAYGYAGAILANRLRSEIYEIADLDVKRPMKTRERLRYCIDGLHLLGKKSDMALCAAELLSRAGATKWMNP